jgi:hypothetical protein
MNRLNRHIARLTFSITMLLAAATSAQSGPEGGMPPPPDPLPPLGQPYPSADHATPAPYASPGQPYPPPGATSAPPPSQPYPPAYPPPGQPYPYPGVVAAPPGPMFAPVVLAPPISSYRWSVSLEALWLERTVGSSVPLGYTTFTGYPASGAPFVPPDSLYSDDVLFPLATGLRFQVSRRLDDRTAIDATYWGLQQWSVDRAIYADPYGWAVWAESEWLQLPGLIVGLDDTLAYTYKSQIHNVEINERVKLNSETFYWNLNWLWGVRYMNLSEDFTLSGWDSSGYDESLRYQTQNNLVGLQTGVQLVRGWDRFQMETAVKIGLAANIYSQHGTDAAVDPLGGTPDQFVPFDSTHSGTGLSGIFEFSLAARCRLSQSLWFRLGYQFYCVTGLALAPRQLAGNSHGGTLALDGLSLGLESAW